MPPEVLSGSAKEISPAIDVWATGIILYTMLFGKFPFDSNDNI